MKDIFYISIAAAVFFGIISLFVVYPWLIGLLIVGMLLR